MTQLRAIGSMSAGVRPSSVRVDETLWEDDTGLQEVLDNAVGELDGVEATRLDIHLLVGETLKRVVGNVLRGRHLVEEVLVALGNIKGRLSRLENGYALASGPAYGQYSRFADAFSRLLQPHKIKLSSLLTDGGLDNLQLLRAGKVQLALSQSDTAYQALHDITSASYFSGQESWAVLGYPGPRAI